MQLRDSVLGVVDRRQVLARQAGILEWCLEVDRPGLLVRKQGLYRRVRLVHPQCLGHRLAQALERDILVLGPFGARAVPAVQRQVGVHQEDGERLVEVVLEVGQVERVGLDDPDADVRVEQVANDRIAAGDVVVELLARLARDAAQDDEQRLVRRPGSLDSLGQVVVNPVGRCLERLPIVPDLRIAILRRETLGREDSKAEGDKHGGLAMVGYLEPRGAGEDSMACRRSGHARPRRDRRRPVFECP